MEVQNLSCDEVAHRMEAYQLGVLPKHIGKAMALHLMRCSSCHTRLWRPLYQNLEAGRDAILQALCGDLPPDQPMLSPLAVGQTWSDENALAAARRLETTATLKGLNTVHTRTSAMRISTAGESDTDQTYPPRVPLEIVLRLEGTALPQIPLPEVLDGYYLDLTLEGGPCPAEAQAPARLRIRHAALENSPYPEVCIEANVPEIWLNDESLTPGQCSPLKHMCRVALGEVVLRFEPGDETDPWTRGTAGVLWHQGGQWSLRGPHITLGRSGKSSVPLPDRCVQTNLEWKEGLMTSETFQLGGRKVPRSHLYLDSFRVAREHAVLRLSTDSLSLEVSQRYPVRVRRMGDLEVLEVKQGEPPLKLDIGDQLMVGHQIFSVQMDATGAR